MSIAMVLPAMLLLSTLLAPAQANAEPTAEQIEAAVAALRTYDHGQSEKPARAVDRLLSETFGSAELRTVLERALVKLLRSDATLAARQFACRKLAVVGSDASLPALAKLLSGPDEKLAEIACYALLHNPSPAVNRLLRHALSQTKGKALVAAITLLGDRRDSESVVALRAIAQSSDRGASNAAIAALGRIATREAADVLARLRASDDPARRAVAQHASLRCARELAAGGASADARAILRQLASPGVPFHIRRGALVGQLGLGGPEAVALVLATLDGQDRGLKAAAIAAAATIREPGAALALGARLPSLPSAEQVLLLDALARLGDPAVRPAIRQATGHAEPEVRIAALMALGSIGDSSCVPDLVKAVSGSRPGEAEAAAAALRTLKAEDADAAILKSMHEAQGRSRAELIHVLADRRAAEALPAILAEAASTSPDTGKAAFRALAVLAGEQDFAALLKLLAELKSDDTRPDAEQALARVAARCADPAKGSEAAVAALSASESLAARLSLLRVLAAIGDDRALAAVAAGAQDKDAQMRNAAVRILADWPDARAEGPLETLLEKSTNPTHRTLALRGCVRLWAASKAAPAELAARYAQAIDRASSPGDRKLVLGALASVAHRDALKLAAGCLKDEAVRTEAAVAAIAIAGKLPGADAEAVNAAMESVAGSVSDAQLQAQAKGLMRRPAPKAR